MAKWSIGKKLFLATALLSAVIGCLGALAIVSLSRVQGNMEEAAGPLWERGRVEFALVDAVERAFMDAKGSLLNASIKDSAQKAEWRQKEQASLDEVAASIAKMPVLTLEASRQALERIKTDLAEWRQAVPRINQLADQGKVFEAQELSLKEIRPLYEQLKKDADLMAANNNVVMSDLRASGDQTFGLMRWLVGGAILFGLAMGAMVFWMVRNMTATLRNTVGELNTGGEQVAAASTQIASTSQTLSQGASEQAASVEEISASMEEMTAMARRNGDSSAEATAMMAETAKQVDKSNVALADMVSSMSAIKESSEKVAKINKTIDEIAFQTNILALNAAVEAARAGEAGMGFAVVADEVRNLAQRSAEAAKDTATLIEESIVNSNQGAQRLELVSTAIRGITESATKVRNLLDEVNESSKQQGQGITQVSTAIQQVSTVTQTSAASAEETAAAAQELSAQSQKVRELVGGLALMVHGGSSANRATAPAHKERMVAGSHGPVLKARFTKLGAKPQAVKAEKIAVGEDPFPMDSDPGNFRSF